MDLHYLRVVWMTATGGAALWTWWNEYGKSVPVKPASRGRKAKSA